MTMSSSKHLPDVFIFCSPFGSGAALREYRKIAAATRGLFLLSKPGADKLIRFLKSFGAASH
jgi:hypothetical protein